MFNQPTMSQSKPFTYTKWCQFHRCDCSEIALFFDSALYYTASLSVSRDIRMRKPVKFI